MLSRTFDSKQDSQDVRCKETTFTGAKSRIIGQTIQEHQCKHNLTQQNVWENSKKRPGRLQQTADSDSRH